MKKFEEVCANAESDAPKNVIARQALELALEQALEQELELALELALEQELEQEVEQELEQEPVTLGKQLKRKAIAAMMMMVVYSTSVNLNRELKLRARRAGLSA